MLIVSLSVTNSKFCCSLEEDYVTSLEYFRRGFEHNLAVIASNGASIYRWEGARFLRIQRIDIKSALPPIWHGIKNAYDGVLLLMAPEKTEFFSWNKFWNGFSKLENPGTKSVEWKRG